MQRLLVFTDGVMGRMRPLVITHRLTVHPVEIWMIALSPTLFARVLKVDVRILLRRTLFLGWMRFTLLLLDRMVTLKAKKQRRIRITLTLILLITKKSRQITKVARLLMQEIIIRLVMRALRTLVQKTLAKVNPLIHVLLPIRNTAWSWVEGPRMRLLRILFIMERMLNRLLPLVIMKNGKRRILVLRTLELMEKSPMMIRWVN